MAGSDEDARRWAIAWEHRGLAMHFAGRRRTRTRDRDDLFQEGLIGLYRAAGSFDPSRGGFSSIARLEILNRHRLTAGSVGAREPGRAEWAPGDEPEGRDETVPDAAARSEGREAIRLALLALPPRWRSAVVRHYGLDGRPPERFDEIAAREGVTASAVWQAKRRAFARLGPALSRFDPGDGR